MRGNVEDRRKTHIANLPKLNKIGQVHDSLGPKKLQGSTKDKYWKDFLPSI